MFTTGAQRALHSHVQTMPDGRRVTIRRAVPSDAPRLLSLSGSRIDRLTLPATAPGRQAALVASDDHGDVVGQSGFHGGSDDSAELVLEVADGWHQAGLGRLLADQLSRAALDCGVRRLTADVRDPALVADLRATGHSLHVRPRRGSVTVDLELR